MGQPLRHGMLALALALTATALAPAQAAATNTNGERAASSQQRIERDARQLRQERIARRAEQRARRLAENERRRAAQAEIREARGFRRLQVPAEELRPRVEKLVKELDWHSTLDEAQKVARRTGKPIVWIHALGDVSGVL